LAYEPAQLKRPWSRPDLFEHDAFDQADERRRAVSGGCADWPEWEVRREWLRVNESFQRDILTLLGNRAGDGHGHYPDTCFVPWKVDRVDQQSERHPGCSNA